VDLIFHANHLDGECVPAMLETGSAVCPTQTHPRKTIDFTQPHDPAYQLRFTHKCGEDSDARLSTVRRTKSWKAHAAWVFSPQI
jgi:hypothetical protein